VFDIDFTQKITILSISELQRPKSGILNYVNTAHKGIDETYSNSENWLSAEVKGSILKPEDVLVNLSNNEDAPDPPYITQVSRWTKTGTINVRYEYTPPRYLYENRLHVITQDEFPGWTFPKYEFVDNLPSPIPNWWDRSACLQTQYKFPLPGMYRLSFRTWDAANPTPSLGLTNVFLIKTYNHLTLFGNDSYTPVREDRSFPGYPYAKFSSKFTAGESQFLLFSGKVGFTTRYGGAEEWNRNNINSAKYHYQSDGISTETRNFYEQIEGVAGLNGDVFCILANKFVLNPNMYPLTPPATALRGNDNRMIAFSIKFRDMYWNGDFQDWSVTPSVFYPTVNGEWSCEGISSEISDHYPPITTPLYEDLGRGYAVRFGKEQDGSGVSNVGTGTLEIELYVFNQSIRYPNAYYPLTLWLQDFNFQIVDAKDTVNKKDAPKAPTYQFGNKRKPSFSTVTNYLMSSYDEIVSFSQVYSDATDTQLDTLTYTLPTFNTSGTTTNFTTTEKPEEMQLRLIKQLISSQVTLSDIIEFTDFINKRQVLYNGRILVRNGCSIDALMNIVNVNYVYRRMNYS
jgi:hypothetical protein